MAQRLRLSFQCRSAGLIPGLGAKMPYASRPKTKHKAVWAFSVQRVSTGDTWASLLLQSHDAAWDRNLVQNYRFPSRSEALLGSCVFPPPALQLPSVPRPPRAPLGPPLPLSSPSSVPPRPMAAGHGASADVFLLLWLRVTVLWGGLLGFETLQGEGKVRNEIQEVDSFEIFWDSLSWQTHYFVRWLPIVTGWGEGVI